MSKINKLLLASKSKRRLDLLEQVGIKPDIILPSNIDESIFSREGLPSKISSVIAREKAMAIYKTRKEDGDIILAADTLVAIGRRIIEKPKNIAQARLCLKLLSGRNHNVYTSICIIDNLGSLHERLVETRIKFKILSDNEIEAYMLSKEWHGKAGGYAIQGFAGSFVIKIIGSYSSVMGLPLYQTVNLLNGVGYNARKP